MKLKIKCKWKAFRRIIWTDVYKSTLERIFPHGNPIELFLSPLTFPIFFLLGTYERYIFNQLLVYLEVISEIVKELSITNPSHATETKGG